MCRLMSILVERISSSSEQEPNETPSPKEKGSEVSTGRDRYLDIILAVVLLLGWILLLLILGSQSPA